MLSKLQIAKHWRTWGTVLAANHWRAKDFPANLGADRSPFHKQVVAFAQTLALKAGGFIVTADDLRHGCAWAALGKPKSFTKFNNSDFDRILVLYELLINPENLRAVMAWNEYENGGDPGSRRRLLNRIRKAPQSSVQHILTDELSFYGSNDLDDLPVEKLQALVGKLES